MDKATKKLLMSQLGQIGGHARAKLLGPDRVRAIALKASRAAKKAAAARRAQKLSAEA